jgi:hypothetical protein
MNSKFENSTYHYESTSKSTNIKIMKKYAPWMILCLVGLTLALVFSTPNEGWFTWSLSPKSQNT